MPAEKKVREPKQQRSIQMKEKILDAAMTLFCQKGYHRTTTNEIAKTAEISIGSLYAYFADKDTILKELLEGYRRYFHAVFREVETQVQSRLSKEDRKAWLHYLAYSLMRLYEPVRDFAQEISTLYYAKPEVTDVLDWQHDRLWEVICDALAYYEEELDLPDIEIAAVVAADTLYALVERVMFRKDEDKDLILEDCVTALYKYLML